VLIDLLLDPIRIGGIVPEDIVEMEQAVRVDPGEFDADFFLIRAHDLSVGLNLRGIDRPLQGDDDPAWGADGKTSGRGEQATADADILNLMNGKGCVINSYLSRHPEGNTAEFSFFIGHFFSTFWDRGPEFSGPRPCVPFDPAVSYL
jgi:hypothetical protein